MKTILYSVILFVAFLFTSCSFAEEDKFEFTLPSHFPDPMYDFTKNRITKEGFELGRKLFYDGILSRDGSVSCGSCHIQSSAFTHHGHDVSHGIDDLLGDRNTPAIMNMAWSSSFFWDGGVHDLDLFAISPIENPVEMDEQLDNVLEKLRNHAEYPKLFRKAFDNEEITTNNFLKALSQFQLSLISTNSKYDQYLLGDQNVFNQEEKLGLALFEKSCASCHSGVLFTDFSFRNNGITHFGDLGRARITLLEADEYKFKVPSLRNVSMTAPYMHDGRFYSLEAVLNHYTDQVTPSKNLDPQLTNGLKLDQMEKKAIIAFLHTLTDKDFSTNRQFSEQ
jgi:cytochrome c peroxidase